METITEERPLQRVAADVAAEIGLRTQHLKFYVDVVVEQVEGVRAGSTNDDVMQLKQNVWAMVKAILRDIDEIQDVVAKANN